MAQVWLRVSAPVKVQGLLLAVPVPVPVPARERERERGSARALAGALAGAAGRSAKLQPPLPRMPPFVPGSLGLLRKLPMPGPVARMKWAVPLCSSR